MASADRDIEPLNAQLDVFLASERPIPEARDETKARVLSAIERHVQGAASAERSHIAGETNRTLLISIASAMLGSALTLLTQRIFEHPGDHTASLPRSDVALEATAVEPAAIGVEGADLGEPADAPPPSTTTPTAPTIVEVESRGPDDAQRRLTRATRPSPNIGAPGPRATDALASERRILDAARSAAVRGFAEQAHVDLERHAREFPSGQLAEERESLKVQVLVALGRMDEAQRTAAMFLARWPESIFRGAVRSALQETP